MGQLLQILGRGVEVEAAELIWQWLEQAAQTLRGSDPAQAEMLEKVISSPGKKKATLFQQRLDEYRAVYPNSHYADLAAASMALEGNRLNDAYESLNAVYSRCPRNVTALYTLGHCCERFGREAEAIAFYQDCLKFKNYLKLPRQRLAAIYFKNGQIEKTTREYESLAMEYPDDLSTLLTLGYLYTAQNQHKRAADTFSRAILIQPDNFCPDTDPIDSLIESGEFDFALSQIDEALVEFPDRPDLLLRRAKVLTELDLPDEALEQYNQAVSVCPDFLEANIKLGSHYLHTGKPDSAAIQFIRAANVNDRIVDAYIGLATAQKLAGNPEEALATLSLASAIETNGPILFAEAVRLQYRPKLKDCFEGEFQPVVYMLDAYRKMLERQSQNPQIHYRLGCLLMSVGRLSQAVELFTKALQLNLTYSSARNKLAVCLYETDEKALALEEICAPTCLQKETLGLHYRLALLYCDKIKFASSMLNLEQWLRETLTSQDAALDISVVLQNLGLIDHASASLDNLCTASNPSIS
jgi:tetratricopeptide (TPR) repeat protein